MTALTRRQIEGFDFIKGYIAANGFAPTFDEIGEAIGLRSKSGVFRLLERLEERGAIRRLPDKARGIELVEARGAEFHLRAILDEIDKRGGSSNPVVTAARKYIEARP